MSRFGHACSVTCGKSLGFLSVTLMSRWDRDICHAHVTLLSRCERDMPNPPIFLYPRGPIPHRIPPLPTGIPRAPLVRRRARGLARRCPVLTHSPSSQPIPRARLLARRARGRTGIQRARWCAPGTWWCRLQDEHPSIMLITTIFPTVIPILITWFLILIRTTTYTTSLLGVFWDRGLRPAKRRGDP